MGKNAVALPGLLPFQKHKGLSLPRRKQGLPPWADSEAHSAKALHLPPRSRSRL